MERARVAGLRDTWRFKSRPPLIPNEYFKGNVATSIIGLKVTGRPKRADGWPNPEFNEAVYNAVVLTFEPFLPHTLTK